MIPDDALRAALAALESHAGHPGTGALHDPLYRLLQGPDALQESALQAAIEAQPSHPAAAALARALEPYLALRPRRLEDVLRADQPLPDGADPLDEVARRLERRALERDAALRRAGELEARASGLERTTQALAAAGAIASIAALLGWLAALGAWRVPWMEPPTPPSPPSTGSAR